MIPTTLDELTTLTGGRLLGDPSVLVTAVTTDTRAVPAGAALFVALRGEGGDGHGHVAEAFDRGAVAALVERAPEPSRAAVGAGAHVVVDDTWAALRRLAADVRRRADCRVVAVTGSFGKTTVKDLTAAAVGAGRRVHASHRSHNNELGVPLTLLGLDRTTEVLVAELGARRPGDIAALARLVRPDIAIVTAVDGVHLELFGTIEAVAATKGELVAALGPDGTAVLNVADPRVAAMAARAPAVIRVATDRTDVDVCAEGVRLDHLARARGRARTPWGTVEFALPLAGRHHVLNALLSLAAAGRLGVDLAAAADALEHAATSPWRGESREVAGVTIVNDAYNANPRTMMAALDTLMALATSGARVAVLGVMAELGPTSRAAHERVGAHCAALGVDRLVVVGRDAAGIAAGARDAGLDAVEEVADTAAAVASVSPELSAGDAVLVKGSRVAGLEAVARELEHELVLAGTDQGARS